MTRECYREATEGKQGFEVFSLQLVTREILFKAHVCANFSKIRAQNGIRTLTLLPFLKPEMVDHLGKNSIHSLFDFIRKSMRGVTLRTRTREQKYTNSKLYNEKQAGIFDVVILRPFSPFIHCFARISSITPFSHCVTYFLLLHSFSSSVKLERYVTSIESHPNRYPQDISLKGTT